MGQPAPRRNNEVFSSGSVFDPSEPSRSAGEGDGDEINSPRAGGRESGRHLRSRSRTPVHSPQTAATAAASWRLVAVRRRREMKKKSKEKKQPGK